MTGQLLLLEDDPAIRELLSELLVGEGHQVRICSSPQELYAATGDAEGQLALVDPWGGSYYSLSTDDRDALVLLARSVPTIVLTAREWATRQTAEELGLVALLRKPFDVEELVTVVRRPVGQLASDSQALRDRSRTLREHSWDAVARLHRAQRRWSALAGGQPE